MAVVVDNDRYHITVTIADRDYDLGVYATGAEAGARMARWVLDRGLCFAGDSNHRLSDAQRRNSPVLVLDVIRQTSDEVTMMIDGVDRTMP